MNAQETIENFWRVQDGGDYTRLPALFADDATLVDPFFGTFEGIEAIRGFMAKMVSEMGDRKTHFRVLEVAGAGEVAWAQWIAVTPAGEIHGCGLYKVRNGKLTYYRDYMNPASAP